MLFKGPSPTWINITASVTKTKQWAKAKSDIFPGTKKWKVAYLQGKKRYLSFNLSSLQTFNLVYSPQPLVKSVLPHYFDSLYFRFCLPICTILTCCLHSNKHLLTNWSWVRNLSMLHCIHNLPELPTSNHSCVWISGLIHG